MNSHKIKKLTKCIALIFVASTLAYACTTEKSNSDSPSTADSTNNEVSDNSTTASGDSEKVTLTLLAYDSFTPSPNIFDDFTAQTGIAVEVVLGGDAGELVTKAGLTSGNPEADVLWGVDNTMLSRAISKDIFTPYATKNLADLAFA
ncbi:MAG: hypothetical protein EBV51_08620 [Acidimicrobiia bacterium]|nr:hypothetical protein [Acidimicrobiia bacterium]